MRLIDTEEVIKAVDKHTFETKDGLCLDDDITCILEEVPTIEERKTGMWEKIRESYCSWSCSVCKEIVVAMPEQMGYPLYDYCPNCGAYMREGD